MRSPREMRIITIDITNVCDKTCSNCSRMCGHHKKPFFMDFETFKRAVDSLAEYQGIRAIIGGEPALHPEFERFVRYATEKFEKPDNTLIYPQSEFIKAIHRSELSQNRIIKDGSERIGINGVGLFSNLGKPYRKHYEAAAECLHYQALNDHMNKVYHKPALISRKDLGIPDDEWFKIRDNCWLQNEWSATITPKGAFFCEIAGALDMLFDGPGGWIIEPGWWKREPRDFADQLHWCELCGLAFETFTRDSAEIIDDVSPSMYEKLNKIDSPKVKSGRVNIIKIENGKIADGSKLENRHFSAALPYIERYEDRFNTLNTALFAKDIQVAEITDGSDFGTNLYKLLQEPDEWVLLKNKPYDENIIKQIKSVVLNPGVMHCDIDDSGYIALFSKKAISLRRIGIDRIVNSKSFKSLYDMWDKDKVIPLDSVRGEESAHTQEGVRFAIWGTGSAGSQAADWVETNGGELVCAFDKDSTRHGKEFYTAMIYAPANLPEYLNGFDYLIVANYTRYKEICNEAVSLGIARNKILLMTDLYKNE